MQILLFLAETYYHLGNLPRPFSSLLRDHTILFHLPPLVLVLRSHMILLLIK